MKSLQIYEVIDLSSPGISGTLRSCGLLCGWNLLKLPTLLISHFSWNLSSLKPSQNFLSLASIFSAQIAGTFFFSRLLSSIKLYGLLTTIKCKSVELSEFLGVLFNWNFWNLVASWLFSAAETLVCFEFLLISSVEISWVFWQSPLSAYLKFLNFLRFLTSLFSWFLWKPWEILNFSLSWNLWIF